MCLYIIMPTGDTNIYSNNQHNIAVKSINTVSAFFCKILYSLIPTKLSSAENKN